MAVIDNAALSKSKRNNGTWQDWIGTKIMEKINERDKVSKKFKKPCLHVDKDSYKEARNDLQKLLRTKKKTYFEIKLLRTSLTNF